MNMINFVQIRLIFNLLAVLLCTLFFFFSKRTDSMEYVSTIALSVMFSTLFFFLYNRIVKPTILDSKLHLPWSKVHILIYAIPVVSIIYSFSIATLNYVAKFNFLVFLPAIIVGFEINNLLLMRKNIH
jgi:hypothetical protein